MNKFIFYALLSISFTACNKAQSNMSSCEGKFDNSDIRELMEFSSELKMKEDSFEKRFFLCLIEERLNPKITSNICYQDIINADLKYLSSSKDYNETELFIAMLFSSNSQYNDEIERIYKKNEVILGMIYPNFDRCAVIKGYFPSNSEEISN